MSYRRGRLFEDYANLGGKFVVGLYFTAVACFVGLLLYEGAEWLVVNNGWLWGLLKGVGYVLGGIVGLILAVFLLYFMGGVLGWLLSWVVDVPYWAKRKWRESKHKKLWDRRLGRA